MRRFAALIALLATVATAAAADAYTIHGRGNGHGIGMSQWGARGYALHGFGYRRILSHYYRGTSVATTGGHTIRVLLEYGKPAISFVGATSAGGHRLRHDTTYLAQLAGSKVDVYRQGKLVTSAQSPLLVSSASHSVRLGGTALNGVTDGAYRGAIELRPTSTGGMTAINVVSVDNYLRGVLAGEVPASWPDAALEAQAVAARSYALTTHAGGTLYDQYPDDRSQVYRGMDAEQPRGNAAVRATANQVVMHDGQIATTFFFSASGGRTENVEDSFDGAEPEPYLKSVRDRYEGGAPLHRWRIEYSTGELLSRLHGLVKGRFRGIRVVKRGASPRVVLADVVGSGGTTRVSGATLKLRLALHDTWARFPSFGSKRDRAVAALPVPLLAPVAPERAVAPKPRPKPPPQPDPGDFVGWP
jgi:stage II sporulation protein D